MKTPDFQEKISAENGPPAPLSPESDVPSAALAEALKERLSIIGDREWYARDASGHLQALMRVSDRITAASARLPAPVHPQLKHYLERCSYDKALAFLSGTPPEVAFEEAHGTVVHQTANQQTATRKV